MDVQVADRLGDTIVDRDEGSVGLEPALDGARQRSCAMEERLDQCVRKIGEGLEMLAWCEQDVTLEHRPVIQEGDGDLVVEHEMGGDAPRDDRAERA